MTDISDELRAKIASAEAAAAGLLEGAKVLAEISREIDAEINDLARGRGDAVLNGLCRWTTELCRLENEIADTVLRSSDWMKAL